MSASASPHVKPRNLPPSGGGGSQSLPSSKSRKDFAEAVMSDVETKKYSSFMFALFDNRDIWDMIYKTLKPRGDARPTGSKENIDDE